jgi:hypothetical protein
MSSLVVAWLRLSTMWIPFTTTKVKGSCPCWRTINSLSQLLILNYNSRPLSRDFPLSGHPWPSRSVKLLLVFASAGILVPVFRNGTSCSMWGGVSLLLVSPAFTGGDLSGHSLTSWPFLLSLSLSLSHTHTHTEAFRLSKSNLFYDRQFTANLILA